METSDGHFTDSRCWSAHARDSADKRFDYYTPALAKRVCRLQARDFTNFGYPCWDGIKDTFRIL